MIASIRLALSQAFHNKNFVPPHGKSAFADSFVSQDIAIDDLTKHITGGKAFTMGAFTIGRKKETFVSSQMLGLDFDDNVSVQDCLNDVFIANNAYLIYPTASSTPENPKTRVMFLLENPITGVQVWERLARGLIWQYRDMHPDDACKDAARLFFGSDVPGYVVLGHTVSVASLEQFAANMEAETGAYVTERTPEDNTRIREMNRRNLADDKKKQRYYSYATKALDSACFSISTAPDGDKHKAIYRYSAKIGNHVGAGMIAYGECETALITAGIATGYKQSEVERTVKNALDVGRGKPTDTDELDREWERKVAAWKQQRQNKIIDIRDVYQAKEDIERQNAEYAAQRTQVAIEAATEYVDIAEYLASDEGQDEQLRAAHTAFLRGNYRSWWNSDTENIEKPQNKLPSELRRILNEMHDKPCDVSIPLGQLSAILNLNNNRSATALVLGQMHTAFITGRLSSAVFSIPMVADAINLSPRMVANAFIELQEGGYIQFVRTGSVFNILHYLYKDSVSSQSVDNPYLNMHPARLYTINVNRDALIDKMHHQITVRKTEEYHARSSAKTSEQMALDMALSLDEYKALVAVDALAEKDPLSKRARAELNTELNGDAKGKWKGWRHALESDFAIAIDWNACESIKDVRAAILKEWVKLRPQNSRTQLCRLLGCSDATLQKIMDEYDIVSIRQNREMKIENPDFRDLRSVTKQIMRDESAAIWMVNFKLKTEGDSKQTWQPTTPEYAGLYYAENRANIEQIYIRYIAPSVLALKSVASWAQKWQQFVLMVAHWMITKHAALLAEFEKNPDKHTEGMVAVEIKPMQPMKACSTPKIARPETIEAQHVYNKHTPAYIQAQLGAKIFMHTPYKLVGDLILESGELPARAVYQAIGTTEERRRGIVQFLIENAAPKLVRKAADYFGVEVEDYDELTNEILQAQREADVKALYDSLVPEFDMPPADKVIQMPQENAKTKAQSVTSERTQAFLDFCKTRMEREHGGSRFSSLTMPAKPPVSESMVDANGLLYEVCGDDLYVDGVKQHMTPELWNFVSRKRKTA